MLNTRRFLSYFLFCRTTTCCAHSNPILVECSYGRAYCNLSGALHFRKPRPKTNRMVWFSMLCIFQSDVHLPVRHLLARSLSNHPVYAYARLSELLYTRDVYPKKSCSSALVDCWYRCIARLVGPCNVINPVVFSTYLPPALLVLCQSRLDAGKQPRSWAGVSDGGGPEHG